ncbi:MAG TPA: hypothetical protein VJH03_00390 [Blastocatellia bacterium]|nr:hypothetical protein [Blastocatellia bacterium]
MLAGRFQHNNYLVRRKVFKLFGGAFHVYDPAGQVVLFANMKAFKLKEDIRLYTGEDMQSEVLLIKARRALDISSEYDVSDSQTGQKVGVLKRKGFKSIVRDEWLVMDTADQQIGSIREDSTTMALVRRFIPFANLIPQRYDGEVRGTPVCTFKQNANPFVMKISLDFSQDVSRLLDRRLGLAAAVLLCAIEGKQQ